MIINYNRNNDYNLVIKIKNITIKYITRNKSINNIYLKNTLFNSIINFYINLFFYKFEIHCSIIFHLN